MSVYWTSVFHIWIRILPCNWREMFPFDDLYQWILIPPCVHTLCSWTKLPSVSGVLTFGGCAFYNVLNTAQTSLCSHIHVCIVDYLSAINIYETTKIHGLLCPHLLNMYVFFVTVFKAYLFLVHNLSLFWEKWWVTIISRMILNF